MRKRSILTGLLAGICCLSLVFAGGTDEGKENSPGTEPSDFKAAFAELTRKVADLEKKINTLEANQHAFKMSPAMVPDPIVVPKGWQQREFNGMPYYVVPLTNKR